MEYLFTALTARQLKQEALKCTQKQKDYYQAKNIRRSTADLGDPTKFGVGDLDDFRRLLGALEKDILDLKQLRAGYSKALRELETAMLKGESHTTMSDVVLCLISRLGNDSDDAEGGDCSFQQSKYRCRIREDAEVADSWARTSRDTGTAPQGHPSERSF